MWRRTKAMHCCYKSRLVFEGHGFGEGNLKNGIKVLIIDTGNSRQKEINGLTELICKTELIYTASEIAGLEVE